jgi:hypothetical protein
VGSFSWMLLASNKCYKLGDPKGIRTPVTTVKGWCPRPLDDRVKTWTSTASNYTTVNRSIL